jgi:hypothetical protein
MALNIIANSNIVFYKEYIEDPLFMYNWRKHSIKAINKNQNFKVTIDNIGNYLEPKNVKQIVKSDQLALASNIQRILSTVNMEKTSIVMIDNSYICNNYIDFKFLNKNICTDKNRTYILIHSFVQSNEVDYKLATQGISYLKQFSKNTIKNLIQYKNLISSFKHTKANIKLIYIPFSISNERLSNLELIYINKYQNSQFPKNVKIRNEINDDFHIDLLNYIRDMFGFNQLNIVTDDVGMRYKAVANGINYILSIGDFK